MSGSGAHVPVVAAVVHRDGRYLLCRRPPEKRHGGLWEFPGGKIRSDESLADAARRELAEELELTTTDVGAVMYSAQDDGTPFVIDFVWTVAEGVPVLHEHTEIGWFTVEEVLRLELAPTDARFAATLRCGD